MSREDAVDVHGGDALEQFQPALDRRRKIHVRHAALGKGAGREQRAGVRKQHEGVARLLARTEVVEHDVAATEADGHLGVEGDVRHHQPSFVGVEVVRLEALAHIGV